jgi:hypothetical protein
VNKLSIAGRQQLRRTSLYLTSHGFVSLSSPASLFKMLLLINRDGRDEGDGG